MARLGSSDTAHFQLLLCRLGLRLVPEHKLSTLLARNSCAAIGFLSELLPVSKEVRLAHGQMGLKAYRIATWDLPSPSMARLTLAGLDSACRRGDTVSMWGRL